MQLFHHSNRERNADTKRVYAIFELVYTVVDFSAAVAFFIGSIFFFYDSLMTAGTWLFVIGSLLFAAKPSLRLVRELKLLSMGDDEDLAERYEE